MKAKAMVAVEADRLELQEFEVVPPTKDQILVKLGATSVCASDPKILGGKVPLMDQFPLIMGHEIAGEVAEIGEEAAALHQLGVGDRITVEPMLVCGHCEWCRTDYNYHKCRPLRAYGATMTTDKPPYLLGGYADYMYLLPGTLPHKIAEDVPFTSACLSSVIANGVRWIKYLGQMTYGQSLVISGVGSQGLATLMIAKECGVGPIAMLGLGRDRARFDLAKEFGAEYTINIETEDPLEAVPDLFGGAPDVVVETSGVPSAIQTGIELVKMTGKVIVIGVSGGALTPINFDILVVKGIQILADHAQAGNVHDAVQIINSQKYDIEKINNVSYSLEDLPLALAATVDPPEGFIKAVVTFQ
jgi:threonine dehydrogenase-like Zn-dependent dehydrogenase